MDCTLTDRVARLERDNATLKRFGALALLGFAAVIAAGLVQRTAGAAAPTRLEAERFLLRDAQGAIRAALETGTDGTPRLALLDATGHERARLHVAANGAPGLTLFDADGKTARAALKIGTEGTPGLSLSDGAGRARAILALYRVPVDTKDRPGATASATPVAAESPALGLYDTAGQPRTFVSARVSGSSGIHLADSAGRLRAALAVGADGVPDLELSDEHRKARAAITVLGDGSPLLNLYDTSGRVRGTLAVLVNGAAGLALADETGKVIWSSTAGESGGAVPTSPATSQPSAPPDQRSEQTIALNPPVAPSGGAVASGPAVSAAEPVLRPSATGVELSEPSRQEPDARTSVPAEPVVTPTGPAVVAAPAPAGDRDSRDAPSASAIARVGRPQLVDVGDDTRVRIPVDRPLTYRAYTLDDPPRLVLDLDNASHDPVPRTVEARGPVLTRIRSAQFQVAPTRSVRIVFDLKRTAPFWVEPDGNTLVVHIGVEKPGAR
jgi:AMIN domain-containing protein